MCDVACFKDGLLRSPYEQKTFLDCICKVRTNREGSNRRECALGQGRERGRCVEPEPQHEPEPHQHMKEEDVYMDNVDDKDEQP